MGLCVQVCRSAQTRLVANSGVLIGLSTVLLHGALTAGMQSANAVVTQAAGARAASSKYASTYAVRLALGLAVQGMAASAQEQQPLP